MRRGTVRLDSRQFSTCLNNKEGANISAMHLHKRKLEVWPQKQGIDIMSIIPLPANALGITDPLIIESEW